MIKDLWTWENTQARKDAQVSNPATPITPTETDIATQPTDKVITTDPSNGGVTRSAEQKPGFDIPTLNRWLQMMGMQWKEKSTIDSAYGVSTGIDQSELWNFQQFISKDTKDYELTKVKLSDSMEESKKTKFLQEVWTIDLEKKQPNSGAAIHPNTWGTFEDITDLADGFIKSTQILNNKELISSGYIQKFKTAYDIFSQALESSEKLDPVARTSAIQESLGELKMAMLPLVEKSKWIIFVQEWGKTSGYNKLDSIEKDLLRYEKLYKAWADEIKNTISNYQNQSNRYAVQYSELTYKSPSINAKSKLNENKAYQIFLDTMMELNPQNAGMIQKFKEDKWLSWEEREFIKTHFEWGTFKELFSMRADAIKNFWPFAAVNFNEYDEIIQVQKLADKDRRNDILENMQSPDIDPNKLMFYINKWY